jgi:hypothetical protein
MVRGIEPPALEVVADRLRNAQAEIELPLSPNEPRRQRSSAGALLADRTHHRHERGLQLGEQRAHRSGGHASSQSSISGSATWS